MRLKFGEIWLKISSPVEVLLLLLIMQPHRSI